MAAPSYTTDLLTYNDCTDATGWVELVGMALSAPPDIDSDLAIHGSICITSDRSKVGLSSNVYVGAGITLGTGECIFVWHKFFAPNSLATLANGGVRVMIGDSNSVYDGWYMDGSDTYPYGGWVNHVVDPTISPDQTAGTTTGTYAMVGNGWNLPTQAPQKGNPFGTDIIRYGRGESKFTDGDVANGYATFAGYALVNDNPTTGRFGLIQNQGGSFLYKGLMSLGLLGTSVDMRDSNVVINIDDTTKVVSGFNRIEINNSASNIEWNSVLISALGTVSRGEFEVIDNATVVQNSCTFTDMSTFIYQSGSTLNNIIFRRCNQVTQGGSIISDSLFTNSTGAKALLIDDITRIDYNDFESSGTGYAVEGFSVAGDYDFVGLSFSDYAASNGTTGNEAVHVLATSGIVNLNISEGGSTSFSIHTDGATVNIIAGAVTVSITVKTTTGSPIENVRVLLLANTGSTLPSNVIVTIVNSTTTATVTHTAHAMVTGDKVQILGASLDENNGVYTITKISDDSYSYTMGSAPGSSPTGTIKATYAAISDVTNGVGYISVTRVFAADQPIYGRARKSSTSPLFKTSDIVDTINADNGVGITTLLIPDE